jgi:putative ATP-dependent endonuclease of OLD family
MKIARLQIQNFRGIKEATLLFSGHVVLVGDNNVGKSTVFEAIDLALGPDRLSRHPKIDEHDFHLGDYLTPAEQPRKEVRVETVVTDLTEEQQNRFGDEIEWWNVTTKAFEGSPVEGIDYPDVHASIRIVFVGYYDSEDDDFAGDTYFARSLEDGGTLRQFNKKDKQFCGFLYLRSLRTGSRALSLEHGSLLDIILRLKEIRPQMWEKTIGELSKFTVAVDPEIGISGVLKSIDTALKKYVPREWGVVPHLKVSNLTRENLRKVISAFIATGDGTHAAPFYRQGTGTLNMLVLAMLSQIAEDKRNVIFAMEEPETAIPPYAQKSIVHEVRKLAAQSIFSSHSPYVLEEFAISEISVLMRGADGVLIQSGIELPASVKPKRYRQEFRTRFSEALLARRVMLAEGATEAATIPVAARRLSEIDPGTYSSLEALGICTVDAGSDSQIADLGKLYADLGKIVYAVCDQQTPTSQTAIEAVVKKLFMHGESDIEKLVLNNTTQAAMERFIDSIQWPTHLTAKFPNPKANASSALSEFFAWKKGDLGLAEFIAQCNEMEIPEWIRQLCRDLRELCQPTIAPEAPPPNPPHVGDAVAEAADLAGFI